jgi:uncharacterized protein YqhQ
MAKLFRPGIRVGGSALPDGVMMLTPLAAAIARQTSDGFAVEAFPLPERKPLPLEKVPFIRILPKLVGQMALVVRGWKPRQGRFPLPALIAAIVIGLLSGGINLGLMLMPAFWHAAGSTVLQLLLFFGLIGVTRAIPQFGRIWRFHGGEHQAIAAYEAGLDLTVENTQRQTLYHPRCGTNLATLAIILMLPGMAFGSVLPGVFGYLVTFVVPIVALCIAFEMMMLGQKRVRMMLWPGLAFQRLTVATPQAVESIAGIMALQAALTEHLRIESLRAASTKVGAHAAQ